MYRLFIAFLTIVSLVACMPQASFGDAITEGEPTPFPTSVIPSRPIYEVQRGDVIDQRSYLGRVSAVTTEQLVFEIDGRVSEVYISNGDDVIAGDILAILDTTVLEAQLLAAQESLAVTQDLLNTATNQLEIERRRASLRIDLAQINLDLTTLRASEPPTSEDTFLIRQREIELDLARLDLDEVADGVDAALEFDLVRAQQEVDNISAQIAKATLIAPMDGRLTVFSIESGDVITAFERIGIVADLSDLEVTNIIESSELGDLTEGLPAVLQRTNSPDEVFDGIIYQLPQPFGLASDGLVHVRFNLPVADLGLALGDRISYLVTIAERQDVLWLPVVAIRQFSGRNFVVVQEDGLERRVDVQLGLQGNDRVEILEGLEESQRVIAP